MGRVSMFYGVEDASFQGKARGAEIRDPNFRPSIAISW